MRLVRIRGGGTGFVLDLNGRRVVDVAGCAQALRPYEPGLSASIGELFDGPQQSWLPMIVGWETAKLTLHTLAQLCIADIRDQRARLPIHDYDGVALDPPLPDPACRIFAMGGNFAGHAAKMSGVMDLPDSVANASDATPPWGFYVIPGTLVGPGQTVRAPRGTQCLDYEAEVGIVLGALRPEPGPVPVWGYTAWNDFSIRDAALGLSLTDHGPLTWSLTKNFVTGNSCGPWMVANLPDVDDLAIACHVNGELRQSGTTAQMTHSFAKIAAYISAFLPLGAGDMILSGTPPGTAIEQGRQGAFLSDGDQVTVTVTGVDPLHNTIAAPG
jgi:2-keto-4-pentenoate hydratase/2-oxohepta-3-ene-1,7-dioic acid hydratase in catechol pathway